MLIFRYLAREVFVTLASLTTILMLIFMSNQFVRYLNRAASGHIPLTFIMKLMMLEVPNLMSLLLPLGFFVALLVAYGRLYADSEMTVLQACGFGPSQLLKYSFIMAGILSILVFFIMIWASPVISTERAKLLRTTGIQVLVQTIIPGRFTSMNHGTQVFYVESMDRDRTRAEHVFLARQVSRHKNSQWTVVWANKAFAETDKASKEDYLVLENGHEYEGTPGKADYQVVDFERYKARLPHPKSEVQDDLRTASTASLLPFLNPDPRKAAELQWRLSVPLMVLTLTLVAVPLSRVSPRSGKFAKLLPAIVLYIIYANFMFIGRNWVAAGKVPVWLGMWWIHLIVAFTGLLLVWHSQRKPG